MQIFSFLCERDESNGKEEKFSEVILGHFETFESIHQQKALLVNTIDSFPSRNFRRALKSKTEKEKEGMRKFYMRFEDFIETQ